MKPITQEEFIALFPNIRFRYIHDVNKHTVQGGNILDLSLNQKGYGIFFTVNGFPSTGKADESRLLLLNASYTDFDVDPSLSQEEKSKHIQDAIMAGVDAGIPAPTIINRTQKGAHLIWLYLHPLNPTPQNVAKWREVQRRVVHFYKGDKAAVDPTRVLRVPYTMHLKDPAHPFEIYVQSYKPEAKCTLDELDATVPKHSNESIAGAKIPAKDVLLNGVKVGEGMRHMAMAQVAGLALKDATTPEGVEIARLALYGWDRCIVRSPEPFSTRKVELDNTIVGILKLKKNAPDTNHTKKTPGQALTIRASDVKSEPINWLWPGRIAMGKLTLIAGDPGLGKSLITNTFAAIISVGGVLPLAESESETGDVILLSAEDDPSDTIKPRLEEAGADCKRVYILQAITEKDDAGKPTQRMFSLKQDMLALEELLKSLPGCRLVVIDPISAYLDGADSYNNTDVRGLLAPLAELAARYKVAVILVQHLNKSSGGSALYRSMGSIAFVAAARAAYVVTKDKENQLRRLFMPVKNNLAQDTKGLAYTVETTGTGHPVILWEKEAIEITADEALGQSDSNEERTDTDWGVDFLEQILDKGPVPAAQVHKEARQVGVKDKALRRAKIKLGAKTYRESFKGGWWWALPSYQGVQDAVDTLIEKEGVLATDGHLGDITAYRDTQTI